LLLEKEVSMGVDVTRREFLKVFGAIGAGLVAGGCAVAQETAEKPAVAAGAKERVIAAVKARASNTPVIWIQGQSCAGCSVSLLNTVHPDIAEVLTQTINLQFHPNVMAAAGDKALEMCRKALSEQKGKFVLVVEGSIPVGSGGEFCGVGERDGRMIPVTEWVGKLGEAAMATLAVGSCAAFGGIPGAKNNATQAKPFSEVVPKATVINIPGCPSHPDWVVGTIAHVLLFGIPELDEHKRPKLFFGKTVHDNCERRSYFEEGIFAQDFGDEGCLMELGCKGPDTYCDAPTRRWNNKVNWCVQSGAPCIGCTSPSFPDHDDGLYGLLPESRRNELLKQVRKEQNV
jgi:hydrogenase small subunit